MTEGEGHAGTVGVALVTEVFHDDPDGHRLTERLAECRDRGATLAVLPELPLNTWAPASKTPRDEDAEPPDGPRHRLQAEAARAVGISLVGGAIVADLVTGSRHNTAFVFGPDGREVGMYRKIHLPAEEGYWESSHYEPGDVAAHPVHVAGLELGLQICSDINRPEGAQVLGAYGIDLLAVPRATPEESYARWRLVLRANAVMASTYLVSVNRPGPVEGTNVGGPSLAVAPDGEVLVETTDPVAMVSVDLAVLSHAREVYPGYLDRPASVYARAWEAVGG